MPVKLQNKIYPTEPGTCVMTLLLFLLMMHFSSFHVIAQPSSKMKSLVVGAERFDQYLPLLKDKHVAVVANHSSVVGNKHLVDTLIRLKVNIVTVFAPEHGFRGEAEAGEHVLNGVDIATGVRIISLYGDHKKPVRDDLEGVDILLFDIQDVGVRFYTYISTLQYIMEACAAYDIPLIVLDRPNPHAHYVDGPVLEKEFASFVGMQCIPVVYGMTIGEYALMLNGEKLLADSGRCKINVVKMLNWDHQTEVRLPVPPSPNLPNDASIRLYPSLCFFEGTPVSLGRGTEYPFQCYGYPGNKSGDFTFIPKSIKGKAARPIYEGMECRGEYLKNWALHQRPEKINLGWLIETWKSYPEKEKYFTAFFDKLAGNATLRKQIEEGVPEEIIRDGWEKDIAGFRQVRMKYLLYP